MAESVHEPVRRWLDRQNSNAAPTAICLFSLFIWCLLIFHHGRDSLDPQRLDTLAWTFVCLLAITGIISKALPQLLVSLSRIALILSVYALLEGIWSLPTWFSRDKEILYWTTQGLLLSLPLMGFISARTFSSSWKRGLTLCILTLYFFIAIPVRFLHAIPDFSRFSPIEIMHIESHWSLFVWDAASRLSAGKQLFTQVRPNYGLGLPLLISILNRFGLYQNIRSLLWLGFFSNYIFAVCVFYTLYVYSNRNFLLATLLSLCELDYFESGTLLYPNQSTLRFIGIPLFFLALWKLRNRDFSKSLQWMAPFLGFCCLYNPETGVALFIAFGAYLWFRESQEKLSLRASHLTIGTVCIAVSAVVWLGVSLLLLSAKPAYMPSLRGAADLLSAFSSGYGGYYFFMSPVPFIIALVSLSFLFSVAVRDVLCSPKNAFRASAAVFIIVWGAYYINRPAAGNLHTYMYVFSFLMLDILRAYAANTRRILRAVFKNKNPMLLAENGKWLLSAGLLVAFVAPAITDSADNMLQAVRKPSLTFSRDTTDVLSGVRLPHTLYLQLLSEQATWKKYSRPQDPCVVFSSHPVFLPPLTCYVDLPVADTFTEVFTKKDYFHLINVTRSLHPKFIFLESLQDQAEPLRTAYYRLVRQYLSADYKPFSKEAHLDVWSLRRG
jgi:hypothetical protein